MVTGAFIVYAIFILLVRMTATWDGKSNAPDRGSEGSVFVQLFLRIYAVVYLVLFVESLIFAAAHGMQPTIIQMIDMLVFTPVAVVGLWSAAYRHLSLPKHTWKVLLFASVFWRPLAIGSAVLTGGAIPKFQGFVGKLTADMSADNALVVTLAATAGVCLLGSLVVIPPLLALYRNAYGDESLLKLMSPAHLRGEITPRPRSRLEERERMAEIAARRAAHRQQAELYRAAEEAPAPTVQS